MQSGKYPTQQLSKESTGHLSMQHLAYAVTNNSSLSNK